MHKVFHDIGFVGNFTGSPVKLGDIFRKDDGQFVYETNIMKEKPAVDWNAYKNPDESVSDMEYTKESGVTVAFNVGANTAIGKDEAEVSFQKKESAFISLKNTTTSSLTTNASFKQLLMQYWKEAKYDKNFQKYVIATSVVNAESGVVIFSDDKNNTVKLKHVGGQQLTNIFDLASGQIQVASSAKSIFKLIFPNSEQPLYRAQRLKPNGELELI